MIRRGGNFIGNVFIFNFLVWDSIDTAARFYTTTIGDPQHAIL